MTNTLLNSAAAAPAPPAPPSEWPRFPALEQAERLLPPLHHPGARTVARDRWERLVTSHDLPAAPDVVWRALTDPEALRHWLALCHGSLEALGQDCVLDFEDGEFFLCRPLEVQAPSTLRYLWRWLGIGQATSVTWRLEPRGGGTRVTVIEEAMNPPWDWQTWNGGGWPGILDQLAAYVRTGTSWRWPWRRMGPYAQVELPVPFFEAWDRLFNSPALKYWLQTMGGTFAPGESLTIMMGDASGVIEMRVQDVVQPGQAPPSFLPFTTFALRRPVWGTELGGRIWIEPAGWGRCVFQALLTNWENVPAGLQLAERRILTDYWVGAAGRVRLVCLGPFAAPPGENGSQP